MRPPPLLALLLFVACQVDARAEAGPAAIPASELAYLPVSLDFREAEIAAVVGFLAKDLALPIRGIGISDATVPNVTLRVENIPFIYVVKFICQLTDLEDDLDADGVFTLHPIRREPIQEAAHPDVAKVEVPAPRQPIALDIQCHDVTPGEFALVLSRALGYQEPIRLPPLAAAGERVSLVLHSDDRSQPIEKKYPDIFFHTSASSWRSDVAIHAYPQQTCLRRIISIDRDDCPLADLCAAILSASGLQVRVIPHQSHGAVLVLPHVSIHAHDGIEVSHLLDNLNALSLMWSMSGDGEVALFPSPGLGEKEVADLVGKRCIAVPCLMSDRVVSVDYHALALGGVARDFQERLGIPMVLKDIDAKRLITLRLDHRSLSDIASALEWICDPHLVSVLVTAAGMVIAPRAAGMVAPRPAKPAGLNDF